MFLIVVHKDKQTIIAHLISHFVSVNWLTPTLKGSTLSLNLISIPTIYQKALQDPSWKDVVDAEIYVVISRDTWELVPTNDVSDIVDCQWVFTVKYHPDSSIQCYKI